MSAASFSHWTLAFPLFLLGLGGCLDAGEQSPAEGPLATPPPDASNYILEREVALEVGPPVEDGIVTGLAFGYNDCVFLTARENLPWELINGTFLLTWADSDGRTMNFRMSANDGTYEVSVPMSSSPLEFEIPRLNVTFEDPLRFIIQSTYPPGEIMTPATAQVNATVAGGEADVRPVNC